MVHPPAVARPKPATVRSGPLFALALASISLIGPLAVHLFMPVIPAVKAALGLSDALAQLTFSIALFTMAFATLVYGSLSDRYGRRPVLLSGLALFLIGSAISAAADSIAVLVLGRFVQAIAAGIGVFVQNFVGAAFAQLYGVFADGTVMPLTETTAISAGCGLLVGIAPFYLARRRAAASV